jgi:hypothetical protein
LQAALNFYFTAENKETKILTGYIALHFSVFSFLCGLVMLNKITKRTRVRRKGSSIAALLPGIKKAAPKGAAYILDLD